jgi:hypothetical protein
MKKTSIAIAIVLALVLVLTLVGSAFATSPKPGTDFNGPHFNLNLVAKDKLMPGDYDNPDRHTMFVPLDSTDMVFDINTPNNLNQDNMSGFKINMTQGAEFAVLDGNATDGQGSFQLGAGKYWVYIAVKASHPSLKTLIRTSPVGSKAMTIWELSGITFRLAQSASPRMANGRMPRIYSS